MKNTSICLIVLAVSFVISCKSNDGNAPSNPSPKDKSAAEDTSSTGNESNDSGLSAAPVVSEPTPASSEPIPAAPVVQPDTSAELLASETKHVLYELTDWYYGYHSKKIYYKIPFYLLGNPKRPRTLISKSGAEFELIEDPKLGTLVKSPNGLLWTGTIFAGDEKTPVRFATPFRAYDTCKNIGAEVPSVEDYSALAKILTDKDGNYSPRTADGAPIFDAYDVMKSDEEMIQDGRSIFVDADKYYPYVSSYNYTYQGAVRVKRFDFYGRGQSLDTGLNSGATSGRLRCVIYPNSQGMSAEEKFNSIKMPTMNSCNPEQFMGEWVMQEHLCHSAKISYVNRRVNSEIVLNFLGPNEATLKVESAKGKVLLPLVVMSHGKKLSEVNRDFENDYKEDEPYSRTQFIESRGDKKGCNLTTAFQNSKSNFAPYTMGIDSVEGTLIVRPGWNYFCGQGWNPGRPSPRDDEGLFEEVWVLRRAK